MARLSRWSIAWQRAGRTVEPWIGPSILEVLPELVEQGVKGVVVCPAGFVSAHLELLSDLDREASPLANSLHLFFRRTEMPHRAPDFFATLADVIAHEKGA